MKSSNKISFPNEKKKYRDARNKLLREEIKLRRKTEEVAKLRRMLPKGGKLKEDYEFEERDPVTKQIRKIKLSELFSPGKDTLVIYNYMFGPNNKTPCVMCTSIMDGINGMVFHANDRINFVMAAKSSIDRIMQSADERGWKNLRMLSSQKNTYNADYYGENEEQIQLPMLNVFRKTKDGIFHFYGTEMLFVKPDKGEENRHVDSIWPLWNLFDLTPEGRGKNWYPKLNY